nr:type II toxin-antitoxin system RelE/ParE family toxin [Algoriphagus oliviformis]
MDSARNDIHEIIDWYSGKEKRLGDRFYQALKSAMEYIKRNPYNCQIAYRDVRNKPLGKFPYQVHYCIEEPDKTLIVL